MLTKIEDVKVSFTEYLSSFKNILKNFFFESDNREKFTQKRGFPTLILHDILAQNPLSAAIPKEYGGRGAKVKECLGLLEAASYESLPLSLTLGINMSLFLQPVAKYAQEPVKQDIFDRFLHMQNMGGLMITEPDHGSDALNMQTSNYKKGSNYHIQGTKHWQGLTGLADYWLISSRRKNESGMLGRDIDFFICDVHQANQRIVVEEFYNTMGLHPIPYGKNRIDIKVPEQSMLIPETTGIKLMIDLLHRSRFHFPGIAMGFIHRMLDEAIDHCTTRFVAGKALIALDQVQHQISRIQSAFTICSAMCVRSAEHSSIHTNLAPDGIEANSMKAYVTDLMQESAQTLTQLSGANGYKVESMGTRAIVDSRPFQIFEGSNDMLYTQISEMVMKLMQKSKNMNLAAFLKSFELTRNIADHFKSVLNFSPDLKIAQRKAVDMGKIISRVVCANLVGEMALKGFRPELIRDSLENIKQEISMLVSSYQFQIRVSPITDFKESGNWLAFS